ncbi:hypothetical protein BAUCODRAFT_72309 [Baudoinia panamericana UAMH 10762]|uniref:Probable endonuclease LCL3 n=1 Tax=Baudoinia panamericana (strain UAMH 10762) TaxID=717646 RepID=M2N7E1_BAUPA|nr:uncharacterized protein BAUCODRAFT_72309 [Baudoinia panamericana UAMH 10762]EMC94984.1 hypothetical protein BAUCODRAFT_72309 [Baudoinia panamericana UAMH 10762]
MPWPDWLWSRRSKNDDDDGNNDVVRPPQDERPRKPTGTWEKPLNAVNWANYTSPQTIIACTITSAATLLLVHAYKTYLRRIPTVEYLKPSIFGKRSLYGFVTRVGDGDNFHLFHTPGGRLAGWGWLPGRRVKAMMQEKGRLKGQTVHVRLAGVDAPELAHFGHPAQPFGKEAREWLESYILGRYVRAYAWRRDQYERVVATVYCRRWVVWRLDVGEEMLRQGLATVYEAKAGAEFGGREKRYREVEGWAKRRKVGMWTEPGLVERLVLGRRREEVETPRSYKNRVAARAKSSEAAAK